MFKRGESMAAVYGPQKTINITYATPRETLQGTPTILATSEPGTVTFSYTIQQSDLPAFDGIPLSCSNMAIVFASGRNTTASLATINYRIKKNGVSLTTGSQSVTASQYWTLQLLDPSLIGVSVSDVIDVYLWQTTANALNWDWNGLAINITRIKLEPSNRVFINKKYTVSSTFPVFSSGINAGLSSPRIPVEGGNASYPSFSSTTTVKAMVCNSTYNSLRQYIGDEASYVYVNNNVTYHPYYSVNAKVVSISWIPSISVP